MATTESSAIVRFIEIQQQKGIESTREPAPQPIVDSFTPAPVTPITRVSKQPTRPKMTASPSSGAGRWVAGAIVVGGLIAGGLYLGRNQLFGTGGSGDSEPVAGTVSMPGAIAMGEREHSGDDAPPVAAKPAEGAERMVAIDPIPHPTAEVKPLAVGPVGDDMATRPTAVTAPQTSPDTGFDLRVKPAGAKVFLDGKPIGIAPLRVRNVVAGTHAVDIEAPEGYFSQHIELAVELDKPQQMRLQLAPVDGPPAVTAAAAPMIVDSSVAEVKRSSRREERRARAKPDRNDRADRELAKVAAAAVSTASPEPKSAPAAEPAPAEVKVATALAAAPAGSGTLRVGAKPPCKIFIDGKDSGLMTPQRALPLSAGKHSVKLVNQEFRINKTMRVRIAAGRSTTVIKDFSASAGL